MKTARAGVVNYLSFVRYGSLSVNDFTIELRKVVGSENYTFSELQDSNNLASCYDFLVLTLDLLTTDVEGGEYELTLYNDGNELGAFLINIIDYTQTNQAVSGVYASTVKTTDL